MDRAATHRRAFAGSAVGGRSGRPRGRGHPPDVSRETGGAADRSACMVGRGCTAAGSRPARHPEIVPPGSRRAALALLGDRADASRCGESALLWPQAPRGGVSRDDGYSCPHNYMLPTKGHCRPPTVTTARSGLAPPPARAWRGRTSPLRSPRDGTVVRCVDAPDRRPWCLPHRWAARIIEPPPSGAPRHTRRTRRRHLRDDRP
jgi:hypothetical protein